MHDNSNSFMNNNKTTQCVHLKQQHKNHEANTIFVNHKTHNDTEKETIP